MRALVLVLLLVLLAACSRENAPTAAYRAPAGTPIVLISIDTLRSDHLPAYGYRGVETPAIDALRRDGILFEKAYSHVPLTLPSHASMLTGWLPPAHGIRDNVGYLLDEKRIRAGEIPYLPALLERQGYATGAAVSAFVLRGKTGLAQGFDLYEDSIEFRPGVGLGGLQRSGAETLRRAKPWLDSVATKPFFFFFHLYEPHTPYQPPPIFAGRFASPYDGEIAEADRVVGELITELKRLEVYDRALIFLVSDHGEGLGDHGEDEHGVLLYREAIQVPLLVKLPQNQAAGRAVSAPAQLIDLVPTIASSLGLSGFASLPGRSLLTLLDGEAPPRRVYSETFYPRLHFGWNELASLIDGRHHYIEGPDPELFDLATDPGERGSVLASERRAFAEMRDAMAAIDRRLVAPGEVDEETRQALAALGYVGSAATVAGDGPLPDPKSQLGTLRDLKEGFSLHARGEYPAAATAFRAALSANPRMIDAWEFLGRSLEAAGDAAGAIAAYEKALELSGGSPQVALAAASLFLELGDLAKARDHARLATATHPSFAHGLLAQIALTEKDLVTAEREADEAMKSEGDRIGPLILLAAVRQAKGAPEEALELASKAEKAFGERQAQDRALLQGLNLVRGKALADLGHAAEAEAAFRREIEEFPKDPRPYSNLAILLALTGRGNEIGPLLKRMVDARPSPATYAEAVKTLRVLGDARSAEGLLRLARGLFPGDEALRRLATG